MTMSLRKMMLLVTTAMVFAGGLLWNGSGNIDGGLVSKVEARVGRPLNDDAADTLERYPVIGAVQDDFENGAETRIRIRNPLEGLSVERARRGRGGGEPIIAQRCGGFGLATRLQGECLYQRGDPGKWLAKHQR